VRWWPRILLAAVLLPIIAIATLMALILIVESRPPKNEWGPALNDPFVESRILECGTENEPVGTDMPAWPGEDQNKRYTRQHRTASGDLQVEVWAFANASAELLQAEHRIEGKQIIVKARWGFAQPDSEAPAAVAACIAKFGVRITFRGLRRQVYQVVAE
jgi:hypothetical protein